MAITFAILMMVVGILVFVVFLLATIFWILSRREPQGQSASSMPLGDFIDSVAANFFGQESAGVWQIRGNGNLVLAADGLYFQRILPSRIFYVDYRDITCVETPNSFLGKTRFTPLLQVNFTNDAGEADAMAWQLADVSGVKGMIEGRMR